MTFPFFHLPAQELTKNLDKMEQFSVERTDNDELLAEALVILDSIDADRLDTSAPESYLVARQMPDEKTAADELLKTAIEAVHAAFPHNERLENSSTSTAKTQQKMSTASEHHEHLNEHFDVRSTRGPLTGTNSTDNITPGRRRNTGGRTRLREQLIQLRSVVQKMENYLETLRSPRSPQFDARAEYVEGDENESSRGNVPDSTNDITDDATMWRSIAMQQFRARRKAEQQNAELRENLAAQIQLSKQVETLLQAQPPHPNLLCLPTSKSDDDAKQQFP